MSKAKRAFGVVGQNEYDEWKTVLDPKVYQIGFNMYPHRPQFVRFYNKPNKRLQSKTVG